MAGLDRQDDRTIDAAAGAGPVLEAAVQELGRGNNHAALVRRADHDVAEANVLDPAILPFDHDIVANADRLGNRDLDSGDQRFERGLSGDAKG